MLIFIKQLCIAIMLLIILYAIYYKVYNKDLQYKYTAIIIEPREHKALNYVLTNFYNNLSDEWQIIVFHGNNKVQVQRKIRVSGGRARRRRGSE